MFRKMLFVIFLLRLSTFPLIAQQEPDEWSRGKTIIVNITDAWTNTNINLNSGDKVTIFAKGCATTDGDRPQIFRSWTGPEGSLDNGSSGFPVPTKPNFSLIAKIGSGGTPFYIGAQKEFIANSSGYLYLGYNDTNFSNNFGYFVAFVIAPSTITTSSMNKESNKKSFSVLQNYPNPFNPKTKIQYEIKNKSDVNLKIYNSLGQIVKTIIKENQEPGTYSIVWDGTNDNDELMPSGQYFYQLVQGDNIETKKALLLK